MDKKQMPAVDQALVESLHKLETLEKALQALTPIVDTLEVFITSPGLDTAIFKELSELIPKAGKILMNSKLDFENPKVVSEYLNSVFLILGAASTVARIRKDMTGA